MRWKIYLTTVCGRRQELFICYLDDHHNSLQLSLDRLSAWADQWQLTINVTKCSVLHIASTTHRTSCIYFINGIPIPTVALALTSDLLSVMICPFIPILVALSSKLVNALALFLEASYLAD